MSRPQNWLDVDGSPASWANIRQRSLELFEAHRIEVRSRFEIILDLCKGKSVLDVGCVGQFKADQSIGGVGPDIPGSESRRPPPWLHGKIAEVASRCVGVDLDDDKVAAMRRSGYEALCVDILRGVEPLADHVPFEVVVAGEVIEHLGNPQGLLDAAAEVLLPGGALVLTTPNPYAPWRAYAGMRRQTWENVDHVILLFPSGMAELAHRAGLELELATTVPGGFRYFVTGRGSLRVFAGQLGRTLLRRPDPVVGYVNPVDAFFIRRLAKFGWLNETALYVLRKPTAAP